MRSATKFRTFSQRAQTTERSEHLLRFHLVREARGEALPVDLLALNFVVLAREFVRLQPVHFKKIRFRRERVLIVSKAILQYVSSLNVNTLYFSQIN